jgi:hypothetical protein
MKITKRADRWYDENNNSWLSEEAATLYSPTLTNCSNCNNCNYCRDCSYCSNCNNCRKCENCYLVSSLENYAPLLKFEPSSTRPELDINDRKLEPDL